jgi:general secretion pathway protein M
MQEANVAAAISTVRGAMAGLSPREKRLLLLLAVVFGVLTFIGLYWYTSSKLADIERDSAEIKDSLRTIQRMRGRIAQRIASRDAILVRYQTRAPALTSFVEEQAGAAHVQVSESQDRPPVPAGRRFTERSVSIRLRAVGIDAVTDFMDRIEAAPFPVAITSVRIRRRFGEANKFDVDDMVITTWDQTPATDRGTPSRENTPATREGTQR